MIIGNGDIAKALPKRDDLLFFASGVSNSQETDNGPYNREAALLMEQKKSQHIVYFSSLAIFYSDTRYTKHKKEMEALVKFWFKRFTIVRLGNITWGDNPHTLINYFRNKVKSNEPYTIEDAYRYIIDKDEFQHWISLIPSWSCEITITGRRMKVVDIVENIKQGKL